MDKIKDNDIDSLAGKLGVDNLHYQNIKEYEDQLEHLTHWPLYREILELAGHPDADSQTKHRDYLKITR